MSNLDKRASTIETNLENGFVYATDEKGINNYFQCCLEERTFKTESKRYVLAIDSDNSGSSEGLSGEHNSSVGAVVYDNEKDKETFTDFLKLARKNGIRII